VGNDAGMDGAGTRSSEDVWSGVSATEPDSLLMSLQGLGGYSSHRADRLASPGGLTRHKTLKLIGEQRDLEHSQLLLRRAARDYRFVLLLKDLDPIRGAGTGRQSIQFL